MPCPPGATIYGYPFGGGWPADLSSIPGAAWIWAPGITGSTGPAEFARYFFSRTFDLHGSPTSGTIALAADDYAAIYVNGTFVGSVGSTTEFGTAADAYLRPFDITALLKPGKNVITVEGKNGMPSFSPICGVTCSYDRQPAGVVFGGSLTFA